MGGISIYTALYDYQENNIVPLGVDEFTSLADRCSDEYGENVYIARAIVSLWQDLSPLAQQCEDSEIRERKTSEAKEISIQVIPTISQEIFDITINQKDRVTLYVFDLYGKPIKIVEDIVELYRLNLGNNAPGIYFLQFKNKNNSKWNEVKKIVKL